MRWSFPAQRATNSFPIITANVAYGARVYTDAWRSYGPLKSYGFQHKIINHAYTNGSGVNHTNGIENFWSCLKRTIKGTYICPRPFHLDAYVDEQVFRFGERGGTDATRFQAALKGADGKRLTYKRLTSSHPRWRTA